MKDAFPRTGYYSLVQYCPDPMRMETATLGLLLFCPDWDCLRISTTHSLGRLRKFFATEDFDSSRLRASLDALEERVRVTGRELQTVEDLRRFVSLRGNEIVLTEPRATKIQDIEADFERLYARAVGKRERGPRRPPVIPELAALFEEAAKLGRADKNVRVEIGLGGKVFEAPYAYQNGAYNLVKPFPFSAELGHAIGQVERLAFESSEVKKIPTPQGTEQRVLVVAKLGAKAKAALPWGEMRAKLEEYGARVEEADRVDAIREELAGAGH